MKRSFIALLAGILLLAACSTPKKTENTSIANNGKVWASLWQQRAAEYKALCFQAYNVAKFRLDEALKNPGDKPLAIVTDIDETILDNSPYDAGRAIDNKEYTLDTWKAWTAKGRADTVPGAPSFFKYAASRGVSVFYISNRFEDERAGTVKNLLLYGLPNVDEAHILIRPTGAGSSKEARRLQVAKTHNIVLLCGDNLADLDLLYDGGLPEAKRQTVTEQLRKDFGSRFIVIPNADYGDFEGAFFNGNYKQSGAQKDSIIRAKIKVDKE
ncbi:5'-nucleotidase, lipoprotein e(P4) family [Mucilaginibacter terrigena]|uniref:5'-nucleotidase, lipoprotein e(P4) family n=1 Tax=Mucilaginibacter terrigena TaxID=2492395 RepID=A0A4Q5LMP6_9SPHI|nr:5'-nucleotidase, lipoprotein e(P4) family [Mucilaginibacter terrigena]RYU90312.1 5'-nucleotidase, lipoprotein e(P4) family [Mucilaginibacter terrigena]